MPDLFARRMKNNKNSEGKIVEASCLGLIKKGG